jgi:hypothetical protein
MTGEIQANFLLGQREHLAVPPAAAEIKIRLQKDAAGHFTGPHNFSVFTDLLPTSSTLFSWFGKRTGRGGDIGPEMLRITLKDAMPVAKSYDLYREYGGTALATEKYKRAKDDIVMECEKAKGFMPELREFGVLVVDPNWTEQEVVRQIDSR